MKIAVLSDVHADLESLLDVLAHVDRLRCDLVVCTGDLVDHGPSPDATIELLRERRVVCIRGNHDRWALSKAHQREEDDGPALSSASRSFLETLPTAWRATFDGVTVAMHHASPNSDMRPILPDQASHADVRDWLATCNADVLIVGHTHRAFALRAQDGGLIVNPGALLRTESMDETGHVRMRTAWPTEGGTFGILELPAGSFRVLNGRHGSEVSAPTWVTRSSGHAVGLHAAHKPSTTEASIKQKVPELNPDLEEAKTKLGLFDFQKPLGLGDWQKAGGDPSVSAAALENAKKKLAEMGERLPLGEGWARRVFNDQGEALKIATGPRGLKQNEAEARLDGRSPILNGLISYAPDHSWVRQVLAAGFESQEAMGRHLGMAEHPEFDQWLREVVMAEQAPAGMTPQAQEFWDRLQQLYKDVPELDQRDLGKHQQWGLDKHGQIVCIDYGVLKGMPIAIAGGLDLSGPSDNQ